MGFVFCHPKWYLYRPVTNTTKERFYDNVTTIIHNVNVTNDVKITLLLSDHRIGKLYYKMYER